MSKASVIKFSGLLPFTCVRCGASASLGDAPPQEDRFGLFWCNDHWYRSSVLTWGLLHEWPALDCFPYALGEGAYSWLIAMTIGSEDIGYLAEAAIEFGESGGSERTA